MYTNICEKFIYKGSGFHILLHLPMRLCRPIPAERSVFWQILPLCCNAI